MNSSLAVQLPIQPVWALAPVFGGFCWFFARRHLGESQLRRVCNNLGVDAVGAGGASQRLPLGHCDLPWPSSPLLLIELLVHEQSRLPFVANNPRYGPLLGNSEQPFPGAYRG